MNTNNKKQDEPPPLIRWIYRRLLRTWGLLILFGMLTILYLFVRGFLRSRGM